MKLEHNKLLHCNQCGDKCH